MPDFFPWIRWGLKGLWENLAEVSILLGGIASVAGYYFSQWKAELADPASLEKLRPYLDDSPRRASYRRTLDRALNAAHEFFGPPVSSRAFGVCLTIAVFYPLLLFLLTWILTGVSVSGLAGMFPAGQPPLDRIMIFALLILAISLMFLDFTHEGGGFIRIATTLARLTPSWIRKHEILWTGLVLFAGAVTYVISASTATALAVSTIIFITLFLARTRYGKSAASFYAIICAGGAAAGLLMSGGRPTAISVWTLIIFTFIYTFVAALLGGVNMAGTAAIIAAGGVTLFSLITEYLMGGEARIFGPLDMSYVVFFCALPSLNAVLDTASWAVSRWLGREMLKRNFHRWGMIGFALLDATLAIVFLCGLAILLGVGGEILDQLTIAALGSPMLDLNELITQATTSPLGEGLWVTLMLFSTLVPTAIHVFLALGSVVQLRGRVMAR